MSQEDPVAELLAAMPTTFDAVYRFEWDISLQDWWIESIDESILEAYGREFSPSDIHTRALQVRAGHRWARITLYRRDASALIEAHATTSAEARQFAATLATHLGNATGLAWTQLDQSEVDDTTLGMRFRQRAATHPPTPDGALQENHLILLGSLLDDPGELTAAEAVALTISSLS